MLWETFRLLILYFAFIVYSNRKCFNIMSDHRAQFADGNSLTSLMLTLLQELINRHQEKTYFLVCNRAKLDVSGSLVKEKQFC